MNVRWSATARMEDYSSVIRDQLTNAGVRCCLDTRIEQRQIVLGVPNEM